MGNFQPALTMSLLAALLCNYGRDFCLIDIGTEGTFNPPEELPEAAAWPEMAGLRGILLGVRLPQSSATSRPVKSEDDQPPQGVVSPASATDPPTLQLSAEDLAALRRFFELLDDWDQQER
jgi:hypothetical protein